MLYLAQATQSPPDMSQLQPYITLLSGTAGIIILVLFLFSLLVNFMIFRRTGMNPWLSLLMLVPIANFIMLLVLAFTEWPVQRALRMCRAQSAGGGFGGMSYPPPPPSQPYNTTLPPPPSPPAPMP